MIINYKIFENKSSIDDLFNFLKNELFTFNTNVISYLVDDIVYIHNKDITEDDLHPMDPTWYLLKITFDNNIYYLQDDENLELNDRKVFKSDNVDTIMKYIVKYFKELKNEYYSNLSVEDDIELRTVVVIDYVLYNVYIDSYLDYNKNNIITDIDNYKENLEYILPYINLNNKNIVKSYLDAKNFDLI